ncbi:hypothetical protein CDD80_5722 [Ophiocordyceps camponoti-rufipedis]|uniref:Uncharacterized protein n=1 Tax=Ophiocordyceps camponoti-rufipedis TaxID=2004952 RepID=A0A2C5YSU6_9HYPO|nr:hypothetical protein CDD80_5722 [Ophiocordyceps camponoti-rufipedis]
MKLLIESTSTALGSAGWAAAAAVAAPGVGAILLEMILVTDRSWNVGETLGFYAARALATPTGSNMLLCLAFGKSLDCLVKPFKARKRDMEDKKKELEKLVAKFVEDLVERVDRTIGELADEVVVVVDFTEKGDISALRTERLNRTQGGDNKPFRTLRIDLDSKGKPEKATPEIWNTHQFVAFDKKPSRKDGEYSETIDCRHPGTNKSALADVSLGNVACGDDYSNWAWDEGKSWLVNCVYEPEPVCRRYNPHSLPRAERRKVQRSGICEIKPLDVDLYQLHRWVKVLKRAPGICDKVVDPDQR